MANTATVTAYGRLRKKLVIPFDLKFRIVALLTKDNYLILYALPYFYGIFQGKTPASESLKRGFKWLFTPPGCCRGSATRGYALPQFSTAPRNAGGAKLTPRCREFATRGYALLRFSTAPKRRRGKTYLQPYPPPCLFSAGAFRCQILVENIKEGIACRRYATFAGLRT